jgi:hypothetical protein
LWPDVTEERPPASNEQAIADTDGKRSVTAGVMQANRRVLKNRERLKARDLETSAASDA